MSFTRSLAASLVDKNIRVNAVAPGPVWTLLIVSSLKKRQVETFGSDSPMARAGEPVEIASFLSFSPVRPLPSSPARCSIRTEAK